MARAFDQFKKGSEALTAATRQQLATYLLSGFGFVAALAWNEAIKSAIEYVFPTTGGDVRAKIIYALVITLVVVIATMMVNRFLKRQQEQGK